MNISSSTTKIFSVNDNINYLKLNGRANLVSDGIAMDYSGDGIEWTADCSGDIFLIFSNKNENNSFACWIDGKRIGGEINYSETDVNANATSGRLQPKGNNASYTDSAVKITTAPLESGIHTFKIAKIAQVTPDNLLTLKAVEMSGSFAEKPENKNNYIEFIGDSITAGLGLLTHNLSDPMGSENTDPTLAYAWQIADAFDADRSLVCAGGIGIGAGCVKGDGPWRQSDNYQYTCAYRDCSSSGLYQPVRTPDLVVVNLGSNDWYQLKSVEETGYKGRPTINSYLDVDGVLHNGLTAEESLEKAVETVVECYKKLLNQIRSFYGNVPILCCVGMMSMQLMADSNKSTIESIYNKAVLESGIQNTYFLNLKSCNSPDADKIDMGGNYHPFYTSHVKNARIIIDYINSKGLMNK